MTGLQKKSQSELIDIILRKDDLERKLREEIKSLKANGCSINVADVGSVTGKTKRLSKKKVCLISIAFTLVVVISTQLVGLIALSMFYGVDFPTSIEQHRTVMDIIRKDNGMLALYLCVCFGVFLVEFIAIHFILHINPFKNKKHKK